MATARSRKPLISKESLRHIAEARLADAQLLCEAGRYAAAIYLGGYAVECYLKAAICKSLDWVELLGAFKTHDLEGLLKYSGFDRQLRSSPDVLESFSRSTKLWSGQDTNGRAAEPTGIRYSLPAEFDKQRADDFFKWLNDPDAGVIPWLRNRID
jgi:HEPN domain-containing protein